MSIPFNCRCGQVQGEMCWTRLASPFFDAATGKPIRVPEIVRR